MKQATDQHGDELDEIQNAMLWRAYMGRVEAVLFAAPQPVPREILARIVGPGVSIDALIDDISRELESRPYEIAYVAGGWRFQTRPRFASAIKDAAGLPSVHPLSKLQRLVLTAIAYFQPLTRGEISQILGRDIGRDVLATLCGTGLIGRGAKSPRAGAPPTYVTTQAFLEQFELGSLRDLPDMEKLESEGLLSKHAVLSGELAAAFGVEPALEEPDGNEDDALFAMDIEP